MGFGSSLELNDTQRLGRITIVADYAHGPKNKSQAIASAYLSSVEPILQDKGLIPTKTFEIWVEDIGTRTKKLVQYIYEVCTV